MPEPLENPSKRGRFFIRIAAFCIVAVVGLCLWHAIQEARQAAQFCWCNNQFKQIGLGMHNYYQKYNCFPPAYVSDATGRPMHSWRVMLLPFIEDHERYQKYNLQEPWDSPNNLKIRNI